MKIFSDLQKIYQYLKYNTQKISFIPTMGDLHDGHISLIKEGKKHGEIIIVSLFVNPTQFENKTDFEAYTVDREKDLQILQDLDVDIVFTPDAQEFYDANILKDFFLEKEKIKLPSLFREHEGANRTGHFEGVYQVLYRLFHIINPRTVIFGEKDRQQCFLVQHLLSDHFPDITLKTRPTIREENGLALSSRNKRLSRVGKQKAKSLFSILKIIQILVEKNKHSEIKEYIASVSSLVPDVLAVLCYLEIRDNKTFELKTDYNTIRKGDIVCIAVIIEEVRLLDNITI